MDSLLPSSSDVAMFELGICHSHVHFGILLAFAALRPSQKTSIDAAGRHRLKRYASGKKTFASDKKTLCFGQEDFCFGQEDFCFGREDF